MPLVYKNSKLGSIHFSQIWAKLIVYILLSNIYNFCELAKQQMHDRPKPTFSPTLANQSWNPKEDYFQFFIQWEGF